MSSRLKKAKEKLSDALSAAYSDFYKDTAISDVSVEVSSSEHTGHKGTDLVVLLDLKVGAECPHHLIHRERVDISEAGISDQAAVDLLANVTEVERCGLCGEFLPLCID